MNKSVLGFLILITSCNLYSQQIRFSKSTLVFAYSETVSEPADTVIIFNDDTNNDLIIDSIYSVKYYGYGFKAIFRDTTVQYYVFSGVDSIKLTIGAKDSSKFIFYNPSLCPICKKFQKINTFTDTILFHSNSKNDNYSYLDVEGQGTVAIEESPKTIGYFSLSQNHPNPFNPSTVINYEIPKASIVRLKVYDVLGREVATLVNEEKPAGRYNVTFDASKYSSGIYFYRITAGDFSQIKKMVLLK